MKTLISRGRARIDKERLLLAVAAPLLAIVAALVVTALVHRWPPARTRSHAFSVMVTYGSASDSQVYILNKATTYYLAGLAVAIGFRMNLFNIGVDGQYRLAAFFAAVRRRRAHAARLAHPDPADHPRRHGDRRPVGRHRGRPQGDPRRQRGHLDDHAELDRHRDHRLPAPARQARPARRRRHPGLHQAAAQVLVLLRLSTRVRPARSGASSSSPCSSASRTGSCLGRTRFGFDLRTVGQSESAAEASGVSVKKMVVTSMIISGAMAGLVGMPTLLNDSHQYGNDFPVGIGFTGIAIALLGRNHPVGIALGALLWGFLERTTNHLEFQGYDKEIVGVIQGVIVLCVVIAYEVVRRYGLKRQQQRGRRRTRRAGRRRPHRQAGGGGMSATKTDTPPPAAPAVSGAKKARGRLSTGQILLIVVGALFLVSAVRVITGADHAHLRRARSAPRSDCAVPIGLAGLAGLWSERAGVVNIGLEGMMILGTFFGAGWLGWQTSPWLGLVWRHRLRRRSAVWSTPSSPSRSASTTSSPVWRSTSSPWAPPSTSPSCSSPTASAAAKGGNPKQSPPRRRRWATSPIPGLSSWLHSIEQHHWFLVSDLAGILGGLVTNVSVDHDPRRAALRGHASSCCGAPRSACGCAPAARTRSPPSRSASTSTAQVRGRRHLRRTRGPRRRVPRAGHLAHLPGGPDRRARLHRPRRHDLRQLAAGRTRHGRGPVRLLRRAPAAQRRRDRPRAAAPAGRPARRSWRAGRRTARP